MLESIDVGDDYNGTSVQFYLKKQGAGKSKCFIVIYDDTDRAVLVIEH